MGLLTPFLTYRYFRPILQAAELPCIRLYDLRHTCATLLLAEENPKVVSERLGHSTVDTHLGHVQPRTAATMQERATARLERLLYAEAAKAI